MNLPPRRRSVAASARREQSPERRSGQARGASGLEAGCRTRRSAGITTNDSGTGWVIARSISSSSSARKRGDKRAYELLVLKYQRKLGRLAVAVGARPGGGRGRDAGGIHQGVSGAAELPGRQRVLHVALPDRHQHGEELPGRAGSAGADVDRVRQRGSRELRGRRSAARREHAGRRAATARKSRRW